MKALNDCRVLLVDDMKTNIDVLVNGLKNEYKLMIALSGESALASAKVSPPDLILLDILMPGMNGYEVIVHLKEDALTHEIPVMFVTAMGEDEDETCGLELGAVDYIRKPFSMPIVKARIRTHLMLRLARAELEVQNEALREAARLREDVERMSRHDLKTPLTCVISAPSLMRVLGTVNSAQEEILSLIHRAGYKMLDMINRSLDLYKMEMGTYELTPKPVELLTVIRPILNETESMIRNRNITIQIEQNGSPVQPTQQFFIQGDEMLCYSMLANLIKNAIEACTDGGTIGILLNDPPPCIRIENDGAVPELIRDHFFEKYVTAGKPDGTGLGTYSARLMAQTQGGFIQLDTSIPGRTAITVHLPAITD